MLGLSLPALKSRVQRGREKIRTMFDDTAAKSPSTPAATSSPAKPATSPSPQRPPLAASAWAALFSPSRRAQ